MAKTKQGGYMNMKVNHLNARLFNKLLTNDGRALYNAEQGKILSALWIKHPQSPSELSERTSLANSTLTAMIKRLEEQGLVETVVAKDDKRRRVINLTELGASQQEIGDQVSDQLSRIFYRGFKEEEIEALESMLERIYSNLSEEMEALQK
ncbi:MAG: MarR family transcriptional regulator [Eubacteriales bacterium]|nr:MarR family transcriptional regulator [Eubacteriales bacterium]